MNWWDGLSDEQIKSLQAITRPFALTRSWQKECLIAMPAKDREWFSNRGWLGEVSEGELYNNFVYRLRLDWQRPDEVEEKPKAQLPFAVIDGQVWDVTEMHFYVDWMGKWVEVHFQRKDEGEDLYRHISIDYTEKDGAWTQGREVDDNFTKWIQAAFNLPFYGGEDYYLRTQKDEIEEKPDKEADVLAETETYYCCPRCHAINSDDWPIEVGAEIVGGGCQECWESGLEEVENPMSFEAKARRAEASPNLFDEFCEQQREERRWELFKMFVGNLERWDDALSKADRVVATYYNDKEGAE